VKRIATSLLCLSLLSSPLWAQSNQPRRVQAEAGERALVSITDLAAAQRRDFAISVVISLAKEATSFKDLALRPRVLARAADILWDADAVNARGLFLRAWEAAEKGDAEEVTIKTKDNPPPMVIALRRLGGHDLRSEVLGLMARRDRSLADEFLEKLESETERQGGNSNAQSLDGWSASEADAKRIEVARRLLNEGLVQQALEIATPSLNYVNSKSITFLSELRTRNAEAADQKFSLLLNRAALDPAADANTVSGLSSYVFTPGVYITFNVDGGVRWTQPERAIAPPNLPVDLRQRFFQVGADILLRRLAPTDQEMNSAGRAGTINVIKRLLPFFEQHAPGTATALRAQITQLIGPSSPNPRRNDNPLLTLGIRNETTARVLEGLQDRIDYARTASERDQIYTSAAATLAMRGDLEAREVADKIDDSARKAEVRQFVDFQFVQLALKKNEALEAIRLAETGHLTHSQRAFVYTQAARILMESQPERGLELLDKAMDQTLRTENGSVERAVLLVGIAVQLTALDHSRAWDMMGRAAQAANACEDFNGENWIRFSMPVTSGIKTIGIGGENFSLFRVFQLLAKNDLYRSIELTKSFKTDAPRATSILAIASAVLKETKFVADAK
jgi:hypothetical protein